MAENYFFLPTLWGSYAILMLMLFFKLMLPGNFCFFNLFFFKVKTLNNFFYLFVKFHVIDFKNKENLLHIAMFQRGTHTTKKSCYKMVNGKFVQASVIKN